MLKTLLYNCQPNGEAYDRKNWIIKFSTVNRANLISNNFGQENVEVDSPSMAEAPRRQLSIKDFYKIIQEDIDEKNWVGLRLHITSIFDWTKEDYLNLTKSDAENFLGAYIYAIGKTATEPQKRFESLQAFVKRYDSFLIDYGLSSEDLLKEMIQEYIISPKYLLYDKRSK
jgi:hypothetical protein